MSKDNTDMNNNEFYVLYLKNRNDGNYLESVTSEVKSIKGNVKFIPSKLAVKSIDFQKEISCAESKLESNLTFYAVHKSESVKSFIVEYMFSYLETDPSKSTNGKHFRKFIIETDNWSTATAEQAILLTYLNFGKFYAFKQKYGDKQDIQFYSILDAYVMINSENYINTRYLEVNSDWNKNFREFYKENDIEKYAKTPIK